MYGSELVLVLGDSGSGKSSSIGKDESHGIKGLDPKNTALINVDGKRLGADNGNEWNPESKNLLVTKDPLVIKSSLWKLKEKQDIKNIVIDDLQYCITDIYAKGKRANKGWDTYDDIFNAVLDILDTAKALRQDQIVFVMNHVEIYNENYVMKRRMKLAGQASYKYIVPEGKASIVLYAEGVMDDKKVKKFFRTQGDGIHDTAKSPSGLFSSLEIPNDLGYVEHCIRKKWNI